MIWLAFALLIDRLVGDPDWLWRRVSHPVVWFGAVISWVDKLRGGTASRSRDMALGTALLGLFAVLALATDALVTALADLAPWLGGALHLAVVVVLLAQKSLADHVRAVGEGLSRSTAEGRSAVAMIVGRDVTQLDEAGVSAAAIESLAENASDGIVAPALWYGIGSIFGVGLAGIVFYKMVNTADSMIGHRTPEHEFFGKPAARLDDVMNWPAARLTALLVVLVSIATRPGKRVRGMIATVRHDALHHRSPNAGWPETAFAGALGVRLGGPRAYGVVKVDGAWLNKTGRAPNRQDIPAGLRLFNSCCSLLFALVVVWVVLAAVWANIG